MDSTWHLLGCLRAELHCSTCHPMDISILKFDYKNGSCERYTSEREWYACKRQENAYRSLRCKKTNFWKLLYWMHKLTFTATAFKAVHAAAKFDKLSPSPSAWTRASEIPTFANLRAYPKT